MMHITVAKSEYSITIRSIMGKDLEKNSKTNDFIAFVTEFSPIHRDKKRESKWMLPERSRCLLVRRDCECCWGEDGNLPSYTPVREQDSC